MNCNIMFMPDSSYQAFSYKILRPAAIDEYDPVFNSGSFLSGLPRVDTELIAHNLWVDIHY